MIEKQVYNNKYIQNEDNAITNHEYAYHEDQE